MRFAEVFLRMGCALVAWMMLYAWVFWLAALHAIGCGPDGVELHGLLLVMAVLAVGFSFLLKVIDTFPDIQTTLRWLGLPLLLLLPFALRSVWAIFQAVNLNATAICSQAIPSTWQLAWAPVQTIALIVVGYKLVSAWHGVAQTESK